MSLQCPYTEMSLRVALLGVSKKLDAYEAEHGKGSSANALDGLEGAFPTNGAELNEKVAAYHGITIETLINSPNYATLKSEFAVDKAHRVMAALKERLGLDDKEAWATLLADQLG